METVTKPRVEQGWLRALIYIFVVAAVVFGFNQITSFISHEDLGVANSFIGFLLSYLFLSVTIFGITWVCRKFIDRDSFKSIGFVWKGFEADALVGFFTGPALLGIGTIVLAIAGYLTFISYSFDTSALALQAVFMLLVALTEELVFRGYLLNNLLSSLNKWIALTISSALFALFHSMNSGITAMAIVNIFVAGFLLGINYVFTKNLWFAISFHFSWNFFQGPVFGYKVSGFELQTVLEQSLSGPEILTGGLFGFEGSALCLLLTGAAATLYGYTFKRKYSSTYTESIR